MRSKLNLFALLAVPAIVATALAQSGSTALAPFLKALNGATSIDTTYRIQTIGGDAAEYHVVLKKPNLARIETPTDVVVANGKEIIRFNRAANTFYRVPSTDSELTGLLQGDEMNVWAPFFNTNALAPVKSRSLGPKSRKGTPLNAVEANFGKAGNKTVTYFLNPADNVARQTQTDQGASGEKTTTILDTKTLVLNGEIKPDTFVFTAPDSAREVSIDEINAGKWFTSLAEAKRAAAASGKKIFVDFMASWCGPCKMLDAAVLTTDKFKRIAAKNLVLLRIDVDAQTDIAAAYSIEAMPTQMVLDKDGRMVDQIVGYGGPEMFYGWLNGALNK